MFLAYSVSDSFSNSLLYSHQQPGTLVLRYRSLLRACRLRLSTMTTATGKLQAPETSHRPIVQILATELELWARD